LRFLFHRLTFPGRTVGRADSALFNLCKFHATRGTPPNHPRKHPEPPRNHPKITPHWAWGAVCDTILCHSTCGRDVGKAKVTFSCNNASAESCSSAKCLWTSSLGSLHFLRHRNLLQLRGAQKMYISWNLIFCLLSWLHFFYPSYPASLCLCVAKVSQVEIMQNAWGAAKYYYAYARWVLPAGQKFPAMHTCWLHPVCGCGFLVQ